MRKRSVSICSLAVVLSVSLVAACSSSTVIRTNVPGSKVYLNGMYVGSTPYTMTDTKIVGSSTQVRIEAPGYEPLIASISRNEQFSVGACIGGVFLLFPFLWIMEYQPDHYYELRPGGHQPGPPPPPGQGY